MYRIDLTGTHEEMSSGSKGDPNELTGNVTAVVYSDA